MKSVFSSASALVGVAAGLLTLSTLVRADKVYLTMPQNNTDAIAGCDMDLGFRVQYSDLAMLQWVQLQVLSANQAIVVDKLDNSTRAEWDDVRSKNITWSIPADLTPGDYILRAFGDAYYYCTENNIRTLCPLPLEDRRTIHVATPVKAGSDPSSSPLECPANLTPLSKPKTSSASSLSSPSLSSSLSSSSASITTTPMLHFNINPDVLNLLQNGDHVAKQQKDQEEKTVTGDLSMETGKGLSQKPDSEDDGAAAVGKEGMKKGGSGSAVNGAGGGEGWMAGGGVGSGTRLAVLLAVALVML
ncbi:hypothetical protein EC957_012067 [Mortierella hygrophila]|uniref:Uncharacterized protein n=1 Tax=Mortierella hygrophila TaxID=979708 RepID=A0A9P6F8N0_9FUNG|nr:hypothetical protein EC957_012067 [Mortierella hygrophila]